MSDQDKADQDKGFLARWSQRKQEAKQPEAKQEAPVAAASDVPAEPIVAEVDAEPEFDLSSLPKLEELTGTTDITAFLKKGVPEHLRNAALRKSWALDPAIRNYVNPALEYAYDWNAPGGVPGGGELGAGVDVARLVSQIMGQPAVEAASSDASLANKADIASAQSSERDPSSQDEFQVKSLGQIEEPQAAIEHSSVTEIAAGESTVEIARKTASSAAPQQPVRRHGSAKPIG
jgi:hypothetical protein